MPLFGANRIVNVLHSLAYLVALSFISCGNLGSATYYKTEEVQCSLTSDDDGAATCGAQARYLDVSNGVTEDIEFSITFQFPGKECVNPRITMDFVSQDFGGSSEYLKVFDGDDTSDPELAQCGTVEGYASGDCAFHNCLDAEPLSETTMADEVDILIFVSKAVDGLHHATNGADVCPGGYNLDANVTLSCDRITIDPTTDPTAAPTKTPTAKPTAQPTQEPTTEPIKDCSKLHIDEFLVDCSVEFDGHGDRIQSLESGGSSMAAALTEVVQDVSQLQQEAILLGNITTTMSVSIDSNSNQLTQHGQDISDLKAAVNGLVNATAAMATTANTLSAEVRAIMEHLDILGDYSPASGMTAVGQMPMEMSDYVLYTLVAINLIVMVCLAIYCVSSRVALAPKYGKVVMFENEA